MLISSFLPSTILYTTWGTTYERQLECSAEPQASNDLDEWGTISSQKIYGQWSKHRIAWRYLHLSAGSPRRVSDVCRICRAVGSRLYTTQEISDGYLCLSKGPPEGSLPQFPTTLNWIGVSAAQLATGSGVKCCTSAMFVRVQSEQRWSVSKKILLTEYSAGLDSQRDLFSLLCSACSACYLSG